ncbi:hypothetical protein [Xanthomonas sp. 3058]|uniref:hypothetical protein n=1 Tax=Xanthomonas sp. 3058 TaxID=3035314 RepID=UPI001620EDFB|nr:hypothetical protein [Xanthomonas sp. 3058]
MRATKPQGGRRRIYRVALWFLGAVAALIAFLFLWAVLPALVEIATGGSARFWFFGQGGFVVGAALAYLALAALVIFRRRIRGARGMRT